MAGQGTDGRDGLDFERRQLVDRFRELLAETRAAAEAARPGTVFGALEACVAGRGRDLLREVLEREAQAAAEAAQKKAARRAAPARPAAATRGRPNAGS
jgi:hypothetical protein